jgi:hypothetical protein
VRFSEGSITLDEAAGFVEIDKKNNKGFLLNYFRKIGHYIADTYLIVIFALQDICEANHIINETRLVHELHLTIMEMYNDNIIKELPSCLKELIETALRRFNAIGLAVIKHYTTNNGSSISFVSCPFGMMQKLQELKLKINNLQQFKAHEQQAIADRT